MYSFLGFLVFLIIAAVFVFMAIQKTVSIKIAGSMIVFGSFLWFMIGGITEVDPQGVGIRITTSGVDSNAVSSGLTWVTPFINRIEQMDITAQTTQFGGESNSEFAPIKARSSDQLELLTSCSVNWKIDAAYAPWIFKNVSGQDGGINGKYDWLENNIVKPKSASAVILATSEFNAIDASGAKRAEIEAAIRERLRTDLSQYHIIMEGVDLRDVSLPGDYAKAIADKKVAEQTALKEKENTKSFMEKETQETIKARTAVIAAKGNAEAIRLEAAAVASNPQIIALRWVDAWNGVVPAYYVNTGGGAGGSGGANLMLMLPTK